jgi:hypothetical protein
VLNVVMKVGTSQTCSGVVDGRSLHCILTLMQVGTASISRRPIPAGHVGQGWAACFPTNTIPAVEPIALWLVRIGWRPNSSLELAAEFNMCLPIRPAIGSTCIVPVCVPIRCIWRAENRWRDIVESLSLTRLPCGKSQSLSIKLPVI